MKLVTIANTAAGSPGAMLRSGEILHFSKAANPGTLEVWIPGSIRAILEGGKDALALVRQLVDRVEALPATERENLRATGGISPANTPLLAPISNPRLLLAAGRHGTRAYPDGRVARAERATRRVEVEVDGVGLIGGTLERTVDLKQPVGNQDGLA